MEPKKINILLTTAFILLFAAFPLLVEAQKNPLVEAIQRFDEGKYTEAESLLSPLIIENPENLMINYYFGASRTENGHYGANEISYLLKGSTGESPLKTDYYLGIQYQAMQQWDKALSYYEKYQKTADQAESASIGLSEKIQQCKDQFSPFKVETEDIAPVPLTRKEQPALKSDTTSFNTEKDSILPDTLIAEKLETAGSKISDKIYKTVPINFDINSEITYVDTSNFQTTQGLQKYLKWKKLNDELDLLTKQLAEWRQHYAESVTSASKNALGEKIVAAESNLFALQRDTRESLHAARKAEIDYWNSQTEQKRNEFKSRLKKVAITYSEPEPVPTEAVDTALIISTEIFPKAVQPPPKKTNDQKNELVYKIQIGAYSRALPTYVKRQFDKLSLIRKIDQYTDEKGVVVYTTGNLARFEDAQKMQTQVRREGIEDAFVVPYFNGKRITLSEAKKLEAEQ